MGHIGLYKHSYLLSAFFYINFQMQQVHIVYGNW